MAHHPITDPAFPVHVVFLCHGAPRRRLGVVVGVEGPFTEAQAHEFLETVGIEQDSYGGTADDFTARIIRSGNPLGVPNPWLVEPFADGAA